MSTDFKAYIAGLVQNFANNGISAEEKDLQYGRQLVLTSVSDKTTLSVYNGKKGIKLVWSGKNTDFTDKCKSVLMKEDAAGADYRLLKDFPNFQGIWAGSDESGKGDFIGPLVVAAVICDEKSAAQLFNLGVKDCKTVSDKDVLKLRTEIEKTALATSVLALTPKMYNYRYSQIKAAGKNLNHLLSSGHAVALCAALAKCPQCNYALVDRFAANNNIRGMVNAKFPQVNVVQMPKAEADIAVAAASVLARAEFLRIMAELEAEAGMPLPKGGGPAATDCARMLAQKLGKDALGNFVKLHFANYKRI